MNYENMSEVISQLRKSKHMTQKELALQLGITDKAVSKWERGLGYPDIKLLPHLAELLGVTTNELLGGKDCDNQKSVTENVIQNTIQYADNVTNNRLKSISKYAFFGLTLAFLISILVCVICDIAVTHTFSWSIYVITSELFVWFTVAPVLYFEKYKYILSLTMVTILIVPFLSVIEKTSNSEGWLIPIGLPCAVISLLYFWIVCLMFTFLRKNKWILTSIAMALSIVFELIISAVVGYALSQSGLDVWDIFTAVLLFIISALFLLMGLRTESKKKIFKKY